MRNDELPELIQRFFTHYLSAQRDLSQHTQRGYRDTFRLLLGFLAKRNNRTVDQLTLENLSPAAVLAFLDFLEKQRANSSRTRNLRLAAVRTFVRFVIGEAVGVSFIAVGHRILAIPQKKFAKPVLGFLTRNEVEAVLAAMNERTFSGKRDRLLFTLLYNTGARITEALQLRPRDFMHRSVHLQGKGRKDRSVPLWPHVERLLSRWCRENKTGPDELIFTNRLRQTLSRDGAAFRLSLAVRQAEQKCPSLKGRRITCHTFRHSCAMGLLQAGVALEVIALWLGHAKPLTTHGYIEADLKMKEACLKRLTAPKLRSHQKSQNSSRLLAFLRAI